MSIFGSRKGLKILFVGTEVSPFAKVGGLSSVAHSLPSALNNIGHDARVMIPRYLFIEDQKHGLEMEFQNLNVPTGVMEGEEGQKTLVCNVKKYTPQNKDSSNNFITYFLENMEYYEQRANVYGYADDPIRWALLCRGALEFIKQSNDWVPDIIVGLDWQAGLIPNYIKTVYAKDPVIGGIASLFSIHNLFFQGMFDHHFVSEMDFDDGHSAIPSFFNPRLFKLNLMRRGIMYADAVNTVSPSYAKEIMTKEYGELLDELLRERRAVLTGILNGIDYSVWDPENDPHISFKYNKKNISERSKNKAILQERFNLPVKKDVFLLSIVSRLTRQKGLDLLMGTLDLIAQELPIQLIVVGEGDSDLMAFFHGLETKYPDKIATHLKFDSVLPHLVYAGADAVLVPSRFEPCGLVQMEAMRMGCIPIVRKTGGLADSVDDYNPNKGTGTGFVFERFDPYSLMIALVRAFENFRDKKKWQDLVKRAMIKDFSWDSSAEKYLELMRRAIKIHNKD